MKGVLFTKTYKTIQQLYNYTMVNKIFSIVLSHEISYETLNVLGLPNYIVSSS